MNKGLMALNDIVINKGNSFTEEYKDLLSVISQELKALEVIRHYALKFDWTWLFNCIINDATYKVYICGCNTAGDMNFANKEEYGLLKEAFNK